MKKYLKEAERKDLRATLENSRKDLDTMEA